MTCKIEGCPYPDWPHSSEEKLRTALTGLVKALNGVVNLDQADTLRTAPLWLDVRAALAAAEAALKP